MSDLNACWWCWPKIIKLTQCLSKPQLLVKVDAFFSEAKCRSIWVILSLFKYTQEFPIHASNRRASVAVIEQFLDIPQRVNYKLWVLTHRCLLGKATVYLSNCCIPVSQVASRRHLRSAARHQLTVPRHRLSTYGRRAFAVAGPTMFNTLPDDLRDPAVSTSTFIQSSKTHFFLCLSARLAH